MKCLKQVVMGAVIVVAVAGVYGALRNLPIVSGCGFYGDCPQAADVIKSDKSEAIARTPIGAAVDSVSR